MNRRSFLTKAVGSLAAIPFLDRIKLSDKQPEADADSVAGWVSVTQQESTSAAPTLDGEYYLSPKAALICVSERN